MHGHNYLSNWAFQHFVIIAPNDKRSESLDKEITIITGDSAFWSKAWVLTSWLHAAEDVVRAGDY